ncbi:N-acetylmuramic acid 6-phosphate etherase [Anaerorhabdus sp.]|jgi:N-acetylmuramic acid 6-phosphate etherase|uniref:N-acetylmuramic acid 6-phosphate etherase n=1 Tax=Anaerorhabdus sp. TaxID=1872524 RepID=UPI002FCB890A
MVDIEHLKTETRNKKTMNLDLLTTKEILTIMNDEDLNTVATVKEAIEDIEHCVELVIKTLNQGGRCIFVGAGTSGRLGILDAVECVPTFATTDEILGIIAGGNEAFVKAVEGAEDSKELAKKDLQDINCSSKDMVIALAASGRTPYAIGALEYAKSIGAKTGSISCNKNSELSKYSEVAIEVDAGPEILTGSTRLKAGTCQKLILNMITTTSMIGIGKVFGNLMVDMKATNEKLVERAKRIVMMATECDIKKAEEALMKCDYHCKTAIVMILLNIGEEEAKHKLNEVNGFVRKAIQ